MKKLLLSLAILCCSPAWADVAYDWQWDGSGPYESWGQMIVTDEAWRSGGVQWSSDEHFPDFSDAPITRAYVIMSGGGMIDGGDWLHDGMLYNFRSAFDIRFVGSGVEGSMYIEMVQEGISDGAGTTDGWEFAILNTTDEANESPCGIEHCFGTGRWVLDQSTVPVVSQIPLPGTAALLALGLITAGSATRRRSA